MLSFETFIYRFSDPTGKRLRLRKFFPRPEHLLLSGQLSKGVDAQAGASVWQGAPGSAQVGRSSFSELEPSYKSPRPAGRAREEIPSGKSYCPGAECFK